MDRKMLSLRGTTIAYIDEGKGEAIVLLHGFCGSSDYWGKLLPELTKIYRVIALDLPGHGQSKPNEELESIEGYAEYVSDLLDALKLEKVTMFGHSLGGYIALAFAERYAQRLNGFSLIHSTAYPDSEDAKQGREAAIEKIDTEGITAFIKGLVPKLFSPDNLEKNAGDIEETKKIGYGTDPQGAKNTLKAMKDRPDRNHILKNTSLPILLVAGEKDQVIASEKVFSVIESHITRNLIKDVGHMSMYEDSGELIKVIRDFLND